MRLSEIARLAPVRVVRDAQFEDLGLLGSADDAILVYLVEEHAIRRLERTPGAVAVITTAELADRVPSGLGLAVADRAEDAFYAAHAALMEKTEFYWKSFPTEIHPTASVHQRAWIEPRNVRIGPRAVIEPHVTIFERVVVGEDSVVRAGTVIGSEGFEFKGPAMRQGRASRETRDYGARNRRVPHAGSVLIGARVEIQASCTIDLSLFRAPTTIGDDTKLDDLVFVAHSVRIGRNCLIVAGSVIAGSATIGDEVWIGPGSVISSGVRIGDGAAVVLGSTITRDVPPGMRISGDLKTYELP